MTYLKIPLKLSENMVRMIYVEAGWWLQFYGDDTKYINKNKYTVK